MSPYGYCPHCGAPGKLRERRPNGNDTCERGCVYPSASALDRPTSVPQPVRGKDTVVIHYVREDQAYYIDGRKVPITDEDWAEFRRALREGRS